MVPYSYCQRCNAARRDGAKISRHGLCTDCVKAAVHNNVSQLVAHDGPNFQKWRRNMVAALGGKLPEE